MTLPPPPTPASVIEQGSPLGKVTEYRSSYAPDLLYSIPRQAKRDELGLSGSTLPFLGEDVWNAYELSWLNPRGKPVVALGTFRIPADSPHLIESKSLKLYLNSFNQSQFDDIEAVTVALVRDLSTAAGASVAVILQPLEHPPSLSIQPPPGELLDTLEIDCSTYHLAPEFLITGQGSITEETLHSNLLKSNCLVTGQPDWATLVIHYRGQPIDRAGLLRYIISFRNHNEFHEQCVERIFCDLMRRCAPEKLSVYARYTRRGGLDINPFRSTEYATAPNNHRGIRQ